MYGPFPGSISPPSMFVHRRMFIEKIEKVPRSTFTIYTKAVVKSIEECNINYEGLKKNTVGVADKFIFKYTFRSHR